MSKGTNNVISFITRGIYYGNIEDIAQTKNVRELRGKIAGHLFAICFVVSKGFVSKGFFA
jgi:hypothetical protein